MKYTTKSVPTYSKFAADTFEIMENLFNLKYVKGAIVILQNFYHQTFVSLHKMITLPYQSET